MNVEEFLNSEAASRDTIDVKRIYIDMAGDLVAGVLLSQIVFWHLPNTKGNGKLKVMHDGKTWLAKGRDDWWEECRISAKQFDRACQILEERHLIETDLFRFAGSPTKHIRINWAGFLPIYEIALKEGEEGVKSKFPKGENPNSPKVKLDIDQTGKTLTETDEESTPETTHIPEVGAAPPPPQEPAPEKPVAPTPPLVLQVSWGMMRDGVIRCECGDRHIISELEGATVCPNGVQLVFPEENVAPKKPMPKKSLRRPVTPPRPASAPPKKEPLPAVIVLFKEVVRQYPHKASWESIIETVQDNPASMALYKKVLVAWIGRGYNPKNIAGQLEWYKQGSVPEDTRAQRANGAAKPGVTDTFMAALDMNMKGGESG